LEKKRDRSRERRGLGMHMKGIFSEAYRGGMILRFGIRGEGKKVFYKNRGKVFNDTVRRRERKRGG